MIDRFQKHNKLIFNDSSHFFWLVTCQFVNIILKICIIFIIIIIIII